ncbi:MAG: bifunctional nicotinamidase/pyrazinamidase [Candidatus Polarisedimenticolia bacterium]
MIPDRAALLAVDIQNGFISEMNELPVPDAQAVIPVINRIMPLFPIRLGSQDWHPPGHGSFASVHPGRRPFEMGTLAGIPQMLWPDHCVQATRGAQLHPDFDQKPLQAILRKGSDPLVDSYSVFNDNVGKNPTGLEGYLRGRSAGALVLAGLALDYCVLYTARDARRLMPELPVIVVIDGCRAVGPRTGAQALEELKTLGALLVRSTDLSP